MKINSFRKQNSINCYGPNNPQVYPFVISDLQQTIDGHIYLGSNLQCRCDLCKQKFMLGKQLQDSNLFRTNSKQSAFWLKQILDGLCLSGTRTLKFHVPDIIFIAGDSLVIFQTNRKDGRLIKLTNSISLKSMYPTAVRLRKEYKNMLEQTFNQKMLQQIDPQFMHIKYFDKFVPPFFRDGQNSQSLENNKSQFRRYILHKNKKFEIQQIEEHKMNDKEPFCLVKYTDGNCQLFNQREFEVYSLSLPYKLQEQIVYVQSYIKYKLETQAIYYSQYTLGSTTIDHDIDNRAEKQTIVLIGGQNKYETGYKDVQTYDELSHEMMIAQPREYVKLITYKIVHYLSMTSRIYIDHIKIKWIMNDIGNIYLQEIMELSISQIPKRMIKYRLPPKDQTLQFYHESHQFVQMYRELKKRKTVNTQIIKRTIEGKNYEQVLQMIDPDLKIEPKIYDDFICKKPVLGKRKNKKDAFFQNENFNTKSILICKEEKNEKQLEKEQSSYQKHLKRNAQKEVKYHKRHNSVNLDKWRNINLSERKQRISNKINNSFTIKIPGQEIKMLEVNHNSSKYGGKCSLRYGLEEDCTIDTNHNTINTYKSFKRGKSMTQRTMASPSK